MRRLVLVAAVLLLAGMGAAEVPDAPTIHNTTDSFWVNHTVEGARFGWYLISGEINGVFYGYNWTGSTWQADADIVTGLGDVGWLPSPTVFEKDGIWYLISGVDIGVFYGYNWTGSTWQADADIVTGLGDVGWDSTPTVFEKDGIWYLISGDGYDVFYGYNWTGSTWQADADIVTGLGDIGDYSTPTVFEKDGIWYLISGEINGVFYGYNWTGSTWQADADIVTGLGGAGVYSAPTVFEKDGIWYLISGDGYGGFYGFNWTGSTWQADADIVTGLGDIGWDSLPTVFDVGGNATDSYNVSVNGVWHNGTDTFYNNTYSAHAWQNITAWAYNSFGTGNLSTNSTTQNTQIPNNPITITNTSDWSGDEGQTVYVDYDATADVDGDTPTFSCNRTDLFTDFDPATGTGTWTAGSGSRMYYIDFGVSDGYGSTSNYTMTVMVIDFEAWRDGGWGNRERIEVNNTCGDNLDGFWVGIVLNTTQCAWADCRDIRLCDPSWANAEYSWYTASFNGGAPVYQENEVIYVHVTELDVNETAWIYFYYNNSNDVPSTCSGMGGLSYYEDFDGVIDGFEQCGDTSQTTVAADGYGGYCIASKNNDGNPFTANANRWQNSYKLLVQPTATWAGYDYWVEPAAAYDVITVMEGQQGPCYYYSNLQWTSTGVWQPESYSFSLSPSCKGVVTAGFWVNTVTSLWTMYDNIYFNQTYPCDPEVTYYVSESKPPAYVILYDAGGNLVQHAQVTIKNIGTGEITDRWKDVGDGIIDMGHTTGTFQIAVRTFDGVFVHTCNLDATPICPITIPIRYNLKVYPTDEYDAALSNVFAGLAEYTPLNPSAFWGMDLSNRGYVPVTNCSGFAMCDIIAEKEGYADYKVEALNWTSKSALVKDYRHNIVMVEE